MSVCVDSEEKETNLKTERVGDTGEERWERVEGCGREIRLRRKSEIERDTHV